MPVATIKMLLSATVLNLTIDKT